MYQDKYICAKADERFGIKVTSTCVMCVTHIIWCTFLLFYIKHQGRYLSHLFIYLFLLWLWSELFAIWYLLIPIQSHTNFIYSIVDWICSRHHRNNICDLQTFAIIWGYVILDLNIEYPGSKIICFHAKITDVIQWIFRQWRNFVNLHLYSTTMGLKWGHQILVAVLTFSLNPRSSTKIFC